MLKRVVLARVALAAFGTIGAVGMLTELPVVARGAAHSSSRSSRPIERDIAFGADPAQRLDLVTPEARDFPTVIFVHGGSLAGGDKADADYGKVCDAFPGEGIACANVNYRLPPAAQWPAPAEDVAAAVAWVHRNIASRGGNPDKLFLLGHSSGAMLVALVGADARYLATQQLTSTILRGVMPMGSIMWDDEAANGSGLASHSGCRQTPGLGQGHRPVRVHWATWPVRRDRRPRVSSRNPVRPRRTGDALRPNSTWWGATIPATRPRGEEMNIANARFAIKSWGRAPARESLRACEAKAAPRSVTEWNIRAR